LNATLVKRKLPLDSLAITKDTHTRVIRTERRTQIKPTCSLFGHGQNLGSTSGEPEFVAQQFFKIPASGGLSRVTSQFFAGGMANIMLLVVRAYMC
jgi:hypothetical protein